MTMPATRSEQFNFLNNLVFINKVPLIVELTPTDSRKALGLQFRTKLNDDRGMLFDYNQSTDVSMHMRNVSFPIVMIFINDSCKIIKIYLAKPNEENIVCENVQYVIETNVGWCKRHKVEKGMRVDLFRQT